MSSLRSFSDFVGSFWAGFFVFLDREAPTVKNCPHDVHVRLSSLEPYANAPWAEPVFSDNIAVTHVIKSKVWTVVPPSFDNTATLSLFPSVFNSSAKPKLLSINNSPELFWVANFLIYLFILFLFLAVCFF
jgi:hypothetical protein